MSTLLGRIIASNGGREYVCASINGDISVGVTGVDAVSVPDSSDRPKDGVEAIDGQNGDADPQLILTSIRACGSLFHCFRRTLQARTLT